MIKDTHQGSEGLIKTYGFALSRSKILVSISETKWHDGDKKKHTPIWFSELKKGTYALFVWNVAFIVEKQEV